MPALIVAFDGVLADTLETRAHALVMACADEGAAITMEQAHTELPGRTFAEVADRLSAVHADPALGTLIAMRAEDHYSKQVAQGIALDANVVREIVTRSNAGDRIVVRADSHRRHVEPLLALSGLEHRITLLRCADDRGPDDGIPIAAATTLARSWRVIDRRLHALQIPSAQRRALESSSQTAAFASAFVDMSTPHPSPTDSAASLPDLPVPLTSDEQDAYRTARQGTIWFESKGRWSRIQGDKATDSLNGLVSNDVSLLTVGTGLYAAALTPKGKMVSDMAILRVDTETFLVLVDAHASAEWLGMTRKYINPRLARTTDESGRWSTWALYGTGLRDALTTLGITGAGGADTVTAPDPQSLPDAPIWTTIMGQLDQVPVRLVRAPTLSGIPGVLLVAPAESAEVVRERFETALGRPASDAVADLLRIEGGRPAMGIDMDENTIPQEANLDTLEAISFSKGCYTGQETVARVHFRGHVNRHLRALRPAVALARGTPLVDAAGKVIGDVRSSAVSPRLGPVAIGMVRREIQPGDTVYARRGGPAIEGEGSAEASGADEALTAVQVGALPFPD